VVLAAVVFGAQPRLALGALVLATWIKLRNPYFFENDSFTVMSGWLPILAGVARAALHPAGMLHSRVVLWVGLFAAVAAGRLLAAPVLLSVAIPKLLIVSGGLVAMLMLVDAANRAGEPAGHRTGHDVIEGVYLAATYVSLPLLLIPAIGFLRNSTGFQGVTSQPQGFAVLYAPLVAYYVMRTIETGSLSLLRWVAMSVGAALLVYSLSRTGVGACLIGLSLGLLVWWRARAAHGFGLWFWLGAGAAAMVLAGVGYLFRGEILAAVSAFLLKGVEGDLNAETLVTTRTVVVLAGWANFMSYPFFGIGFGIPTVPELLEVTTSSSFGVALSAPFEKGNGFVQVLEETGLVGAALLVAFLVSLARGSGLMRNASAMALVVAALATNLGEATIYSLGGIGLAQWAYVMLGMTLQQPPRQPPAPG
jgi:hypothetical protein